MHVVTNRTKYFFPTLLFILISTFSNVLQSKPIEFLSPRPGAQLVSPQSMIVIRYNDFTFSPSNDYSALLQVHGDVSGDIDGVIRMSDDFSTLNFKPHKPFTRGETVTVSIPTEMDSKISSDYETTSFSFTISDFSPNLKSTKKVSRVPEKQNTVIPLAKSGQTSADVRLINGVSVPTDFPTIKISVNDNPSNDPIFLNTWGAVPYVMIIQNDGTPLYYKRMLERPYDFKVQPTGLLSHFQRENVQGHIVMDDTYSVTDTVRCANGYTTDDHDFHILPNGNYLLIASQVQRIDLSTVVEGGHPSASVYGNHIQELDPSKNVILEWRCWDHYKFTDANHADLTAPFIDYTHMNAVDVDRDGNLLVSTRNFSEITKINRKTGEIIWRFGGVNNEFTFTNDSVHFSYQHSIRSLRNGHYILFDNGSYRGVNPRYSRVVEYELNERYKTATLIWEYRHDPDYFSDTYGNAQRLVNGNTVMCWGTYGLPKLIEVRPNGDKAFELNFEENAESYRSYRFAWRGQAQVPYLVAESQHDRIRLLFNKFGDNYVAAYRIYGGQEPHPTTLLKTVDEPYADMKNLDNNSRYYFRVTAINNAGQESDFSNEVFVNTHFTEYGENLVRNGDFSNGTTYWSVDRATGIQAIGSLQDSSTFYLDIHNGGSALHDLSLVQNGIELVESGQYRLSLAASADAPRLVSIHLKKIYEPYTDYSEIGYCQITRRSELQTFEFDMQEKTDYKTQLVIECGGSNSNILFDNIMLQRLDKPDDIDKGKIPTEYTLSDNFPNPFNTFTKIEFSLPHETHVRLNVYNVLGKHVRTLVNEQKSAGNHMILFDASQLSSGLYFYTLTSEFGTLTKRMLLIK